MEVSNQELDANGMDNDEMEAYLYSKIYHMQSDSAFDTNDEHFAGYNDQLDEKTTTLDFNENFMETGEVEQNAEQQLCNTNMEAPHMKKPTQNEEDCFIMAVGNKVSNDGEDVIVIDDEFGVVDDELEESTTSIAESVTSVDTDYSSMTTNSDSSTIVKKKKSELFRDILCYVHVDGYTNKKFKCLTANEISLSKIQQVENILKKIKQKFDRGKITEEHNMPGVVISNETVGTPLSSEAVGNSCFDVSPPEVMRSNETGEAAKSLNMSLLADEMNDKCSVSEDDYIDLTNEDITVLPVGSRVGKNCGNPVVSFNSKSDNRPLGDGDKTLDFCCFDESDDDDNDDESSSDAARPRNRNINLHENEYGLPNLLDQSRIPSLESEDSVFMKILRSPYTSDVAVKQAISEMPSSGWGPGGKKYVKERSRYYTPGPVCGICEGSHATQHCKNRKCYYCGHAGHPPSECPEAVCRKCQFVGHTSKDCPVFVSKPNVPCRLCGMQGHRATDCTDSWRQFHSTTSANMMNKNGEFELKKQEGVNPRQYCCNCGQKGHFFYECPTLPQNDKYNCPVVSRYDKDNPYSEHKLERKKSGDRQYYQLAYFYNEDKGKFSVSKLLEMEASSTVNEAGKDDSKDPVDLAHDFKSPKVKSQFVVTNQSIVPKEKTPLKNTKSKNNGGDSVNRGNGFKSPKLKSKFKKPHTPTLKRKNPTKESKGNRHIEKVKRKSSGFQMSPIVKNKLENAVGGSSIDESSPAKRKKISKAPKFNIAPKSKSKPKSRRTSEQEVSLQSEHKDLHYNERFKVTFKKKKSTSD